MKTNFTSLRYAVICLALSFISLNTKADNTPTLSFTNTPSLVSGSPLTVGAVYKFNSVASGTDVLVTIVSATGGATVAMLDDNSLTKPEAFSPQINIPANSTGLVTFRFDFISGSGLPKLMTQFAATAMDIDGNNNLHEIDVIDMGLGSLVSYLASTLQINVVQSGTKFTGTNTGGVEYSGVDTSAKQVMFTVTSPAVIGSFTYQAGANNQANSGTMRQKGIYFKGFDYLTFLPVKYSSFDAVASDNVVNLKWTTETEINNDHFEVERSFDGTNFKTIGLVLDGFATGNTGKAYMFKDNSSALADVSVVYYRLKQIDLDGRYTYTNILVVRLQASNAVKMQVMPNPVTENLTVRFTAEEKTTAQIQIINMEGRVVLTQNLSASIGSNNVQLIGISKLTPGAYVVRLYTNGTVAATQKIIKN